VVTRLIRVSYGPFQLGKLKPGEVEEIKRRVLREQLGLGGAGEQTARLKPQRQRKPGPKAAGANPDRKPQRPPRG
jgi:23S rRNA pseudouridine2605 synthase